MRGTDFFLLHYNITAEEFIDDLKTFSNFVIPSYLCAHPRLSFLQHIKECIFIDFVYPIPDNIQSLICICVPSIIEPTYPHQANYFDTIERAWTEYIYIRLEELEICPINPQETCQYLRDTMENPH